MDLGMLSLYNCIYDKTEKTSNRFTALVIYSVYRFLAFLDYIFPAKRMV